ncbi:hypothetical protein VP01_340g8 [Puccinia sorghi]|uniref:Uncharacterized protein n=1 Tax=Puccinia sorghi TaxID=27349 RepID=A0A0L6UWJ5_9BASI|nr:hypothetical protein VP01_340g8 [Puccinia sorghi]
MFKDPMAWYLFISFGVWSNLLEMNMGMSLGYESMNQSNLDGRQAGELMTHNEWSSVNNAASSRQLPLWRRHLGDMTKLAGLSWTMKDGSTRAREDDEMRKAETQWSNLKDGCSVANDSCVEITEDGAYVHSR